MSAELKVSGVPLSPYAKKVLAVLRLKGMQFTLDPVTPLEESKTPEFMEKSPLGKIPFIEHGDFVTPDSSVICDYLESIHPESPVYPQEPKQRARALWFEEYADTRLFQVFVGGLFAELVLKPKLLKQDTDQEVVRAALEEGVPEVCTYLEKVLPKEGFLFGEHIQLADISLGGTYINARHADFRIDAERWPTTAAYFDRVLATDVMQQAQADDAALFQKFAA
jgi:glutathione S-transferase